MSNSVETFFDAWGLTDATAREQAVRSVVTENIYYVDPSTAAPLSGAGELVDHVAMFTANRPGSTANVVGMNTQNRHVRATVDFFVDGKTAMRGQYFCDLNTDDMITKMVGFIGTGDDA